MRVNVYAEEMTDRVEIVSKEIDGQVFQGVRFYLGFPFVHREDDDDTSAVTFWGKRDLALVLIRALDALGEHHRSEQFKERAGTKSVAPAPASEADKSGAAVADK